MKALKELFSKKPAPMTDAQLKAEKRRLAKAAKIEDEKRAHLAATADRERKVHELRRDAETQRAIAGKGFSDFEVAVVVASRKLAVVTRAEGTLAVIAAALRQLNEPIEPVERPRFGDKRLAQAGAVADALEPYSSDARAREAGARVFATADSALGLLAPHLSRLGL